MSVYGWIRRINAETGEVSDVAVTTEWIDANKPRTILLLPAKVSAAVDESVAVGVQLRTAQRDDGSYEDVAQAGTVTIRVALDGDPVDSEVTLDASGAGSLTVSAAAAGTLTVVGVVFDGAAVACETITIEVA